MSVLEDCEPILDLIWKLPLGQGGGRDNIIKDTALGVLLEAPDKREAWAPAVRRFLAQAELAPGLYLREKGNLTPNSIDNLQGTIVVAKALGMPAVISSILDRGLRLNWTYSVQYPETAFNAFLPWRWKVGHDYYGRFVGFPPFLKLSAGCSDPSDFELGVFWESVQITCETPKDNTSDKILLWMQFQVLPRRHMLVQSAFEHFRTRMWHQYGTLDQMLKIYYPEVDGLPHPFVKAAQGRIF